MNVIIFGAAGFIGTNLIKKLAEDRSNDITVVDSDFSYFKDIISLGYDNVSIKVASFNEKTNYDDLLKGQEVLYHLVSTTIPSNSNANIAEELRYNVLTTAILLDECVRQQIKRVIFVSSGGTVYGKDVVCPIKEKSPTDPICSYGIQKLSIEKLLYLYQYLYGLDYRIVRLANPYGPYQRPNGKLGAVTTFVYRALNNELIQIYGDGSIVRDYIFIDDVINAMINIANDEKSQYRIFNIGSGCGTSINELLLTIQESLQIHLNVEYQQGRKADVPVNYLDISRYENVYGKLCSVSLSEGIKYTARFLINYRRRIWKK